MVAEKFKPENKQLLRHGELGRQLGYINWELKRKSLSGGLE